MKNKPIALVTGASSGIGEAIVKELVKQNWTVIGIGRSTEKLSEIKNGLGEAFIPLTCDVSQKSDIDNASQQIRNMGLCPTLFFLNAGLAGESVLENSNRFDLKLHEKIMQVNYFGVLGWVEFWEKLCLQNNGANFVATSSLNAIFAPPNGSAYSASKAAIAKAFEGLSLTYFGTNLRFSVVYPGPVDTAGLKASKKLPFTWSPEKMASHIINFALSNKSSSEPSSLFYKAFTRILRALPSKYTMRLLGKL